jgi:hypothetical protein
MAPLPGASPGVAKPMHSAHLASLVEAMALRSLFLALPA